MRKTFVIEVIGCDLEDIERGLDEAIHRIKDFDFESPTGEEYGTHEDGTDYGYMYEVYDGDDHNIIQSVCLGGPRNLGISL